MHLDGIDDRRLMVDDAPDVRAALVAAGATVIGYQALREVMRAGLSAG